MVLLLVATMMLAVGGGHGGGQHSHDHSISQQQQPPASPAAAADFQPAAATATPAAFWRFEDKAAIGADSAAGATLAVPHDGSSWTWAPMAQHGVVGGFVSLMSTPAGTAGPVLNASAVLTQHTAAAASGFSFELLIKLGRDFNRAGNTSLMKIAAPDGGLIELALERHTISVRVDTGGPAGAGKQNSLEVPMDQVGRRTYFYLADGGWHHLAASLDLAHGGALKLWIDGESPDGCAVPLNLSSASTVSMAGALQLLPQAFSGAIDEVALYTQAL